MKTTHIIFFIIISFIIVTGCEENQVPLYDHPYAINFDKRGKKISDLDTTAFTDTINFAKLDQFNQQFDTLLVPVRVMGRIPDKTLRIKLVGERGSDLPAADILFKDSYVIKENEYSAKLPVIIKKPIKIDEKYKIILKFDYNNSDVIEGVSSLQTYTLIILDEFKMKDVGLDLATWEKSIKPSIGEYSNIKLRFIVYAFSVRKPQPINIRVLRWISYYPALVGILNNALKAYNDEHPDEPLKDENGNLVKFTN